MTALTEPLDIRMVCNSLCHAGRTGDRGRKPPGSGQRRSSEETIYEPASDGACPRCAREAADLAIEVMEKALATPEWTEGTRWMGGKRRVVLLNAVSKITQRDE
jgi:hypothetical protein